MYRGIIPLILLRMKHSSITLRTLLDHIQAMRYSLETQMNQNYNSLYREMRSLHRSADMKMEHIATSHSKQMTTMDKRLDEIEVTLLDQKHERRIRRLERLVGTTK